MIERARRQPFFRTRLSLILGALFLLFVAVSVGREWFQNYSIQKEINALEEEAHRLESRRSELLELTQSLEGGGFLEEEARVELGLQRPGETVLVVETAAGSSSAEAENRDQSNPVRWFNYFVHHGKAL